MPNAIHWIPYDRNGPESRCGSSMTPSPPGWSSTSCRYEPASGVRVTFATWPMSMAYTWVRPPSVNGGLSAGAVSESRSRAVMSTVPVGGGRDGRHRGALLGFHIAPVDEHHGPAVDGEGRQHLVGGRAPMTRSRASTGGTGR